MEKNTTASSSRNMQPYTTSQAQGNTEDDVYQPLYIEAPEPIDAASAHNWFRNTTIRFTRPRVHQKKPRCCRSIKNAKYHLPSRPSPPPNQRRTSSAEQEKAIQHRETSEVSDRIPPDPMYNNVKETVVRINKDGGLFNAIDRAHRELRPFLRRILALKAVQGFDMYECHAVGGYHTPVELDHRTETTLADFYTDFETMPLDVQDRWRRWIAEGFNAGDVDRRHGNGVEGRPTYGLRLVLKWSVPKLIGWGLTPVILSLVVGFWYMIAVDGDDRVAIVQTAWTISSYIISTAGGKFLRASSNC